MAKINLYRCNGEWCYAIFNDDGFNCSDTVGCPDEYSDGQVMAEAAEMFPGDELVRVPDVDASGRPA